jgi:hypothetical protein
MNPFNRLPGSRRAPSGLEWVVLRKLPFVLLMGSLVGAGFLLLLQNGWPELAQKESLKAQYATIGLVLFFWFSMLTLALLCAIIVVMKGHAYVMDAYPLPDERDGSFHASPMSVEGRRSVRLGRRKGAASIKAAVDPARRGHPARHTGQ